MSGYYLIFSYLLIFGGWISWTDSQRMIIPDICIWVGFVSMLLLSVWNDGSRIVSPAGMIIALGQMALVRTILPGKLGLGDVKYATLLGAMLGLKAWIILALVAAGVALLHIALISIREGKIHRERIPFAPFLTLGGLVAFFLT